MNNLDVDDFLASLGFPDTQTTTQSTVPAETSVITTSTSEDIISDRELRDIMADNGIETSEEADAEEILNDDSFIENVTDPAFTAVGVEPGEHYDEVEENNNTIATNIDNSSFDESFETTTDGNTAASTPLIEVNSPTVTLDDSTSRFSGTEWYQAIQEKSIIIAGLGGIGSWCALTIARFHPLKIVMYDDDIVERANMSGQLYGTNSVGQFKVNAMHDMLAEYTNVNSVFSINQKFTAETEAGDIMICGFDSMLARKVFFGCWKNHVKTLPDDRKKDCLFIDGRLSIDTLQVFCITGDDEFNINRYKREFLFSDREADETVCSLKQTSFMACMIGSIMANLFVNFVANNANAVLPYDLPFFTEYNSQNMIFKTEN